MLGDFVERAHAMVWCNPATIDGRGWVRSRVVHPVWDGGVGSIGTRRGSAKAGHLRRSPYVSLASMADVGKPVHAEETSAWVEDAAERERTWERFRTAPPPLGFDDGTAFAGPRGSTFFLVVAAWRPKVEDAPSDIRVREDAGGRTLAG